MRQVAAAVGRGRCWQRGSSARALGWRGGCLGTLITQGPRHAGAGSEGPFLFYIAQFGEKDGLRLREGVLQVGASSRRSSPAQPGAPRANLGCLGAVPGPVWGEGELGGTWAKGEVSVGLVVSLV